MSFSKLILLLIMTVPVIARAQFTYTLDQTIPVTVSSDSLSLAWSGGLNSPEFNRMDINGDGFDDLIIFDRTANQLLTYLNVNQSYRYAPEFVVLFPDDLNQWLLLRDINCDGKKDIFTSDPFGIKAYINTTPAGGPLSWRGFNQGKPILTIGFSGTLNLQVNSTDIPAIDDVDGDGDLDILDAQFVGVGSLEWHKNMTIENMGVCDSMQFKKIINNWGHFEECNCGSYIFSDSTSCPVFGGRFAHAAGKSLLTIDLDNDGDRDLLFSEETCTNLYVLPNNGTAADAEMTSFYEFPSSASPLTMQIFPASYLEDVDFDGVNDLIVSANIYTRNLQAIDFNHSVWFFKNTGTAELPIFSFVKNNFLQDKMIDVGDNSVPAWIDADGDGDQDLFVGNYIGSTGAAGIYYYENTGTINKPILHYVTNNYAGLMSLGFYNMKPQFADMDGDGNKDLAFTATDSTSKLTSLYYVHNLSVGGLNISGQSVTTTAFRIEASENILIVDVGRDGKNDVLVGKSTGALQYWINNGFGGTLDFSLQAESYLGLGTSTSRQSIGLAADDLDGDGRTDLITGDQRGTLSIFPDFRNWTSSSASIDHLVYNPLTTDYGQSQLGGHVWPSVVNLFNSNKPLLISGNTLGGLLVLKNNQSSNLPDEPVIDLYPNPSNRTDGFKVSADRNVTLTILTTLGIRISDDLPISANQLTVISTANFAAGLYIARFSVNGKIYNKRFVVI